MAEIYAVFICQKDLKRVPGWKRVSLLEVKLVSVAILEYNQSNNVDHLWGALAKNATLGDSMALMEDYVADSQKCLFIYGTRLGAMLTSSNRPQTHKKSHR
jgi:hypothetical protein